MVQNSLSFCLSEKLLISPSYLNEILAGYNNLGCRLFSWKVYFQDNKDEEELHLPRVGCLRQELTARGDGNIDF